MQGHTHRLAAYQDKWVLVNYWATWCSPCLTEIPELNRLKESHPNLIVLGIAMQSGSIAKVTEFVAAHDMRYPVVMGTREIVAEVSSAAAGKDKGLEVLPTTLLFGPKGELVYEKVGAIDAKSITQLIK
jgi:thiol-disulfide isomerase/thioredoxin